MKDFLVDIGGMELEMYKGEVTLSDNHPWDPQMVSMSEEVFARIAEEFLFRREYEGICQVASYEVARRLECQVREGGGRVCERSGPHGDKEHWWSEHTMIHDQMGNGYSCDSFTELLDYDETMEKIKESDNGSTGEG